VRALVFPVGNRIPRNRHEFRPVKTESRADEGPCDATVQFIVEALYSNLLWWFQRSPRLSPAQADAIFRRLTLSPLDAVAFA